MTTHEQNRLPYLAPLDGIRAIAIMAVLLFHIWPAALTGGFTGVDVFFVLSGFLITSIILRDLSADVFSLKEFYLRRIQRLLPNLIVTVLAVVVLWRFLMPPTAAVQPASHGLWSLFSLANFYVWLNLRGYWGTEAVWAPLTHFWSLGVEEQFYLLFPTGLLLLTRYQAGSVRFWLAAAAAFSLAACIYGTTTHGLMTFYLLPTRGWELLLGAALAAWRARRQAPPTPPEPAVRTRLREAMGWIGLGLMVAGFLEIDERHGFPGWVALVPTVGTVLLLAAAADGGTGVARLLSTPFMVATGRVSYSLYLWHWPLIVFGKMEAEIHGLPRLAGAAIGGLAGILLGGAAYVAVERPLRRRGAGRARRLGAIAAGFGAVVIYCGIVATRIPEADPDHRFDRPTFFGALYDAGATQGLDDEEGVRTSDVYFPNPPPRPPDAWRTGGVMHLYGGGRPRIVVFGSSHAMMYSRLIDDICRARGLSVSFFGMDYGTPAFFTSFANPNLPTRQVAREFDDTRRKFLREWRPEAVFAIDRWDAHVGPEGDFAHKLGAFLRETSPLVGRVIFVAQVPTAEQGEWVNLRGYIDWRWSRMKGPPRLLPDLNEPKRREAVGAAEAATVEYSNLRVLRADLPFYEPDGSIRYAAGRKFFYLDDDHLTDVGTEEVRPLFEDAIAEAHGSAGAHVQ